MTDLTKLTYAQIREGFHKKDFLASDVIRAYKKRADDLQYLNIYVTTTFKEALEQAEGIDEKLKKGEKLRPLEGYPLAVKDNFCTKGVTTTACSALLKNFVPFYESTLSQRLKEAGCVMLGKTNMDEFAMGSSTENSAYGPSINPWKNKSEPMKQYSPGGSSGGSSAAVAARVALGSTGSDTGGSIRQPAAFCGLVGLKPTYGRCSRYGIIAFASSLDQGGPLTQNVQETIDLFSAMSGVDRFDSTTANLPPFEFKKTDGIKNLTIGLPKEFLEICSNEEIKTSWLNSAKVLESMGATIKEVSLKDLKHALPAYYITAPAEAASNLARFDGIRYGVRHEGKTLEETYVQTRSQGFGEEVKRRIMVGNFVLSSEAYDAFYVHALKVRRLLFQEFRKTFEEVDVLLTPATPSPAFALGEKISNPMEMYLSDIFTVGVNLAGVPAMTVPVGLSKDGLPMGVQLIANSFDENTLFNAALELEKTFEFRSTLMKEIE